MGNRRFGGISAAMVTPYDEHGKLNCEMVTCLTRYIIEGGVDGILVCGSTGEFTVLSTEERKLMAETVAATAGPEKVMVNISSMYFAETVELIQHARDIGAGAVSAVTPYYYAFDRQALQQYFTAVACEADTIPLYLYNMPANAKNTIVPELLGALCKECKNLAGIKDSSMDFMVLTDYLRTVRPDVQVLTGNDAQVLCALQSGSAGAVIACAGLFPALSKGIMTDYLNNDLTGAQQKQNVIYGIRQLIRKISPVTSHKKVLEYLGFPMGKTRLPFRTLNEAEEKELRTGIESLGLPVKEAILGH